MSDQEKQFSKGFNNGYLIAQHQPDLFDTLEKHVKTTNDYVQGFIAGGKERGKEKSITPHKNRVSKSDKLKDNEMDKDI